MSVIPNQTDSNDVPDGFPLDDLVDAGIVHVTTSPRDGMIEPHAAWGDRFPEDEAIYCLPPEVIRSLALPSGENKIQFLDPQTQEAECAFTDTCAKTFAVGVFQGEFICQSPFLPPKDMPKLDPKLFPWAVGKDAAIDTLDERSHASHRESLAYIYRLWTSPIFRDRQNTLRAEWLALPDAIRPAFPLDRIFTGVGGEHEQIPEVGRFRVTQMTFLDDYGLQALLAWDHPLPQRALHDSPFPPGSPLLPSGSVTPSIPLFDTHSRNAISESLSEWQVTRQKTRGLDPALLPTGDVRKQAQQAKIVFLERAIRQRFPGRKGGGIVTHIEWAAAAWTGLSEETVRIYRKECNREMSALHASVVQRFRKGLKNG